MDFLYKFLTVKVRIALVSAAFVAGLVIIGAAYVVGSGKVATAFADARAFAALDRSAGEIGAAAMELRSTSLEVRYRRQSDDLRKFAGETKDLSDRIDRLAASARSDVVDKQIAALKTEMQAIGKQFASTQEKQQALGDSGSGGLIDKAATTGEALTELVAQTINEKDTIEAERMQRAASAMLRAQAQYDATFDDSLTGAWEVHHGQFDRAVAKAGLAADAEGGLRAALSAYADAFKAASGAELDFMRAAESVTDDIYLIAPILKALGERLADEGEAAGKRLAAAQSQMRTIIFATILLALAGGLASAVFVGRTTARPLAALRDAMFRLAGGDLAADVPALARVDEIGQMARSVATFKQAGLDRERLEREAVAHREANELERRGNEAERAERAHEQGKVVAALARGCERLSTGNLTFRIAEAFPPAYQKLKDDFNAAIAQMQRAVAVISATTQDIRANASELSRASDDLSRRTEQQAETLEETAAALNEITQTVKKAAESALHARKVVAAADGDAKQGAVVVKQAVEAMDGIAKSAKQITHIIGVIDEIAFQTNLLALNAGVEAARAGDAGRGFAVVASEVRALAQRSAEAAKEIKGLISASTAEVGHGVELVGDTGAALERIMAQVADVNIVIAEIAAGAREQSTGLDAVNVALGRMDQATQQNAAMVQQSTAASRSLSHDTSELSRLVGQFEVDDDAARCDDAAETEVEIEETAEDADEPMRRALREKAPHAFAPPSRGPAFRVASGGR
jgi:methyl-accepting chemotaxis protein